MADSTPKENKNTLKYVSLITLTLQNAILGLSMRYAATRTKKEDRFISSTAVVMAEVTKLVTCLVLVFYEHDKNAFKFGRALRKTIIENKMDTLKVCVPSLLYVIQNNLLYVSAANLDAATNQVSYQLKILTTAIFAVLILRKKLLYTQWTSLLLLVAGVAMVQLAKDDQGSSNSAPSSNSSGAAYNVTDLHNDQNRWLGFGAVLGACVLSGFAGIFFEKILKGADISVWMRNVQMSLLSIPLGFIPCFFKDYDKIVGKGFFHGYDLYVVYLVGLNACGGLLVAMVVKYADNILKGFATSLAIIITCIVSVFIFDFQLTILFSVGAILVMAAIFLYGYVPKPSKAEIKASIRNLDQVCVDKEHDDTVACEKLTEKQ